MNPTALQDAPQHSTPVGEDDAPTVVSDMEAHEPHAHRKPAPLPNRVGFVALIAAAVGLVLAILVLFVTIAWFLPLVAIVPAITLGVLGLTLYHHRKLTSIAAIVVALIALVPVVSGYMVMTSTQAAIDAGTTAEFSGPTPNLDALMQFLGGPSGDGSGGADNGASGDGTSTDSAADDDASGALTQPGDTGDTGTTPGSTTPGTTAPGTTTPGTTTPGSTTPGTTTPGTTTPGTTTPGATPATPIVDVRIGTGAAATSPSTAVVAVTTGSIGSLLTTSAGAKVTVNSSTCNLPLVNALGISLNVSGVLCAVNVSVTNGTDHVVSINSGSLTGLVGGTSYGANSALGTSLSANVAVGASAKGTLYVLLPLGSTKLDTVKILLGGEPASSLLSVKVS